MITKEVKMWRCVNDLFGYCSGEPDWSAAPKEVMLREGKTGSLVYGLVGGRCKLDRLTCGRFAGSVPPAILPKRKLKAKAKLSTF